MSSPLEDDEKVTSTEQVRLDDDMFFSTISDPPPSEQVIYYLVSIKFHTKSLNLHLFKKFIRKSKQRTWTNCFE